MIKELIKLANHLDAKGLTKEAGKLDEVLRSILQMLEDETETDDETAYDMFIDNKGRPVGAEPASGNLGSTCIMNEGTGGGSRDD